MCSRNIFYITFQDLIKLYGNTDYFYKENASSGPLSGKARKKLAAIIVDYTIRENIWLSLKDFPILCCKIKEVFPKESEKLYFIGIGRGNSNPTGLLYNMFRRRHYEHRLEIGIERNQRKKTKKEDSMTTTDLPNAMEVLRQQLISRSEPWNSVMEWWKATFHFRRIEVMQLPTVKVLDRWPKFKQQPKGIDMVS